MAQVTVMIDGKAYRMACEEGQEDHLTELASRFDQYVSHLKGQLGEIGDLRLTVMAGIMVMDELSEVSRKLSRLESEAETLRRMRDSAGSERVAAEETVATAIAGVAAQIQSIAAKLSEKPAPSSH